jgi:Kef-type K+ transport system membrane component KefB
MIKVDADSFLVITLAAAIAALTVAALPRRIVPPVVVLELLLGILIGPQVLDLAQIDDFTDFFGNLGLGMLFFFAGYELDFERLRGRPLVIAGVGWVLSLALAYAIGGALAATGIVLSLLYTGSAMATTAIGTLIPILRDAGDLRTKFGTYLLGAGAAGEFGPILLVTIFLSTTHPLHEAALLLGFTALAAILAVVSVRTAGKGWEMIESSMEASSQAAIRILVVLVFGLVALAGTLGLDILLGGFVAGIVTRLALRGREVEVLESKLTAVGYGFLIPFFFVTSGMAFDIDSLLSSAGAILKVPMFLALFLLVRGIPALLLYRGVLAARERAALAFFCATELPLVVAITSIATDGGHMRSSTAAALVGAAILSTLIYPFVGLALRRRDRGDVQAGEVGTVPAGAEAASAS